MAQLFFQLQPQREDPVGTLEMVICEACRNAKTGDPRDVFGARTAPTLLPSPGQQRLGAHILVRQNQRAHALRAAGLVPRERQEIDAQFLDVDGDAPERLHRIAEHIAAMLLHKACCVGDWMDDTGLIVGKHQGNQRRTGGEIVRLQCLPEASWIDSSGRRDGKPFDCMG